jgi:3'-phosphoadenosine 5'-phosphosulfate sulfotransferase (PAPS reductase)/FAD synthetase
MPRQRMFLSMSCVDAARERMRHIYDTFDTVCIQFSGGKDSTAILYLAKEIHEERNLGPVKVIFRDEEMLSPTIVKFVEEVRDYDWVDMEWYCLPMGTDVWVLGRRQYCLLWSAQRAREGRLTRQMPEWAIKAEDFGLDPNKPIPQTIDYYTMQGKKGKVAFVMGVRANESMIRYRSLVQKLHENYIVVPYRSKRNIPLRFAKPIYDWTTDDVFKFIVEEHGGTYCEYYDLASSTGSNTRVGIPLHAVAVRRIGDVVATEPEFYDRLWEIFPHLDAQRRIWPDYDIEMVIMRYARDGWDGVRRCIEENILTKGLAQRAFAYSAEFRRKSMKEPLSYPVHWLIRNLLMHEFIGTSPHPIGPGTKAYSIAMKEASELADMDALDIKDEKM